jgi:hypothetical protein
VFDASDAVGRADLVRRVLGATVFTNPDIGPLNDVLDVDCFVLSIPKCGTTALQRGFERAGQPVIHAHTNASTFAAFANGGVLRDNGLDMETLLRARIETNARPVHVFFGYRDPVSWYLSLAGQFLMNLDDELRDQIVSRLGGSYPWNNYAIDDIALIIERATGISPLDARFDPVRGYGVARSGAVRVITYRLDRLQDVARYIEQEMQPGFALTHERVNGNPVYQAYKDQLRLPRDTLETLYQGQWFNHFYGAAEREKMIGRWSGGIAPVAQDAFVMAEAPPRRMARSARN